MTAELAPIPVNEPVIGAEERRYVIECLETGWISSESPIVKRFEDRYASTLGRRHAIAVANGSVALDLALAALELAPGDEVILPTFTIISCATAILRAGAVPVVADSEPTTWNVDVDALERLVGPRTRAILVVHTYGLPADLAPILDLAARRGLRVIEDAAEAHGLTYRGRPCGSFGDLSTFSFYSNKHVAAGEGGLVATDDDQLAAFCRSRRNLCFEPQRRFVHEALGWNYRMGALQAALALGQLERLDQTIARKRAMGRAYAARLAGTRGLALAPHTTAYAENTFWVYGVVLADEIPFDASEAMRRLSGLGIGTRPFFWPMHEQPVLRRHGLFDGISCPIAERLARRGFYVPSGVGLTEAQIDRVAAAVRGLVS